MSVKNVETNLASLEKRMTKLEEGTQNHGPSFWKINNSLLEDPTYVELIRENVPAWLSEINFCPDYRIVWDWIKYNIRRESISYSKQKAREKREKLKNIEETLKMREEKTAEEPSYENLQKLETAKSEYEREYDYNYSEGVNHSFSCNMVRKR